MNHYEERLERDEQKIRARVRRMGDATVTAIDNAVRAILTHNQDLAAETVLGDPPINRQARELDHRCHVFVARHLPSAGHLRFVSAVLRLSKTLERIGDYAETISRAALQLSASPPEAIAADIEMLAQHARNVLAQALDSFDAMNEDQARATRDIVREYGSTFDKVFADLVAAGDARERPMADLFGLMAIANRLERVIHQGKNICEQVLFAVTGERKENKTFHILFVDSRNAGASLLAEHFCKRAWPDAGEFESAGWSHSEHTNPDYVAFAATKGFDISGEEPRAIETVADRLGNFDIIIDLVGGLRDHVSKIPFHTTVLNWPLTDRTDPQAVYQQLAPRLQDLMTTLRGDEDDED